MSGTKASIETEQELIRRATALVAARACVRNPRLGLVLGSGLGGLRSLVDGATVVPLASIIPLAPHSVPGHTRDLVHGTIKGREVMLLDGRLHPYEGHPSWLVGLPVRILHSLGVRTLLLTNAAGSLDMSLPPGSVMVFDDHLNLSARNPLVGRPRVGEPRFPDMSVPYDPDLSRQLLACLARTGLTTGRGIYACMLGPSYETVAEIAMLARLGINAVGMSTVYEQLVANGVGMRVVAISCVTNFAAGIGGGGRKLTHAEVVEVAARARPNIERGIVEWIEGCFEP